MRNAWTHKLAAVAIVALIGSALGAAGAAAADPPIALIVRSVDGSANNAQHPTWGKAGLAYRRVAPANYADGRSTQVAPAKPDRYVSNRIFNDLGQNLFSENGLSQWGWLWGQFIDHDLGLRVEAPGESSPLPFNQADPLERFTNDLGALGFSRTPAAPAPSTTSTRQQLNTITSYMDASMVYGSDAARATWLRDGASLLLPNGFLPRADARGNAASAPAMDLFGNQVGAPGRAVVAGDARANENIGLTAAQTLFAREHNRIVRLLPASLSAELRYQIARRVVGAEIQYITYHDFLPAMGVRLAPYTGYKPTVDPTESNEFATVGFRAHSMVHGEMEPSAPEGTWSAAQLAAFAARGIVVEHDAGTVTLVVPLSLAFGDPDLLEQTRSGHALRGARGGAPVQERRADRRLVAQRPVRGAQADDDRSERVPGTGGHQRLLRRGGGSGRRRHRARSRSRDAELRPDARGLRTGAPDPVRREHPGHQSEQPGDHGLHRAARR